MPFGSARHADDRPLLIEDFAFVEQETRSTALIRYPGRSAEMFFQAAQIRSRLSESNR
jgi:hypothetical protein